jgi:serine protease
MFSARPNLTPGATAVTDDVERPPLSVHGTDRRHLGKQPAGLPRRPGNFDQGECYCTQSTCGAGMLDANAAVRAALGVTDLLQPAVAPADHQPAGRVLCHPHRRRLADSGRAQHRVAPVDPGAGRHGRVVPRRSGQRRDGDDDAVGRGARGWSQLALTDDRGLVTAVDFAFDVAAAPGDPGSGGGGGGGSSGGGGGGGMSWAWLLGLAAATWALRAGARAGMRAKERVRRP